jgi:hypothetical protein
MGVFVTSAVASSRVHTIIPYHKGCTYILVCPDPVACRIIGTLAMFLMKMDSVLG